MLAFAAPQELRQLREREALVVYGRLVPTKLRLRTYFDNRWLACGAPMARMVTVGLKRRRRMQLVSGGNARAATGG
jgi:hypothetical protein